jgi:hypothetical protein
VLGWGAGFCVAELEARLATGRGGWLTARCGVAGPVPGELAAGELVTDEFLRLARTCSALDGLWP